MCSIKQPIIHITFPNGSIKYLIHCWICNQSLCDGCAPLLTHWLFCVTDGAKAESSNRLIYYQLLDFCLAVVRYIDTVRTDSESSIVHIIDTSQLEAKLAQAGAKDIWHRQKGSSLIRSSNLLYYPLVGCWLARDKSLSALCNDHERGTLATVSHFYTNDMNLCSKYEKSYPAWAQYNGLMMFCFLKLALFLEIVMIYLTTLAFMEKIQHSPWFLH